MISAVLQCMNKIEGHPKYCKDSFVTVTRNGIGKSSLHLFVEGEKPPYFWKLEFHYPEIISLHTNLWLKKQS